MTIGDNNRIGGGQDPATSPNTQGISQAGLSSLQASATSGSVALADMADPANRDAIIRLLENNPNLTPNQRQMLNWAKNQPAFAHASTFLA